MIEHTLPRVATNARPGSPEKIRVLTARAQAGRELHHPDDATLRGGSMSSYSPLFRMSGVSVESSRGLE